MDRKLKLQRLRELLKSIAPAGDLESVAERIVPEGSPGGVLESMGGASVEEHCDYAREGVQRIAQDAADSEISDAQLNALEAIVLPRERPVVFIQDNGFKTPPAPWQHFGRAENRKNITSAIPSVGRIELPDSPWIPYGGTGFVVGDELLMTNRHVAELFAAGLGKRIQFKPGQTAQCDFKEEYQKTTEDVLKVDSIVMIHPYWDMALLRIKGLSAKHPVLKLSVVPAEELSGRDVAVIGYPAKDVRNDMELQDRIFEKVYNVKRLHPGLLRTRERINSFGNRVNALTHDSSTLGGNSGSAVLDVKTGQIVGLHFAGIYLKSNYAVPAWELARDTQVVNAGVNFAGKVPATQEWAAVWKSTEHAGNQEVSVTPPSPTGEQRPPATPAVKIEQSPATGSTAISPIIVANGGVTWTIPLQVTVSLGQIQQMLVTATTAGAAGDTVEVEGVQPKIIGDLSKRHGFNPQFLKLANGNPILPPELTKAGKAVAAPLLSDGSFELRYHHFSVVMHKARRLAIYTAANVDWRVEPRLVNGKKPTRKELTELGDNDREAWATDPRIAEEHQLPDIFYTNDRSSFDKGHLVRRDDVCYGTSFEDIQKANGDTYHTTNCSPQTADFNRSSKGVDNWGDLEELVRKETSAELVMVFAGPVLANDDPVFRGRDRDGVTRVQIPRKFWKIIVAKGKHGPEAFGFVLEQDLTQTDLEMAVPKAWRKFMKPIAEIEKLLNKLAKLTHLKPIDQFGSPLGDAIARKVNS